MERGAESLGRVSAAGHGCGVAASPPDHVDLLHTQEEIDAALSRLAVEADRWAEGAEARTGCPLLALCVLRGGVFFYSDLLLRMRRSVEPVFCRAHSYAKTQNGTPLERMRVDWQMLSPRGREVMLVDNICDSGRTLMHIDAWLRLHGARRVRTVTMVHRLRRDAMAEPALTGFTYRGPEWLVGYGMRDQFARLMNTRWIGKVREAVAEA